jgi:hypothetical protein
MIGNSVFLHRLGELSARSDLVWLVALVVGLGFTLIAAFLFPFSPSGVFWAYAGLSIRASLFLWSGQALRGRGGSTLTGLFQLGLVAGVFELLVDWALIHWVPNGRLVYLSGNDVVLLGSPVWMPLAWACVIVEIGYPTLRIFEVLRERLGLRAAAITASLTAASAAAVTVGFYEYFAYRASWWRYEPAYAMIGDFCALYIPLGEFFMFLLLLPIAATALSQPERALSASIVGGARFAAAIGAGYATAYLLLEAGRTP